MRRNIYIDKDTEAILDGLPNLNLSLLVREALQSPKLHQAPIRIITKTPPPAPTQPPLSRVIPEGGVVFDGTVLYSPTIAEMDALGATSVALEWYDESSDEWRLTH